MEHNVFILFFFFLPDQPTHHYKRRGDGKRNILWEWPYRFAFLFFCYLPFELKKRFQPSLLGRKPPVFGEYFMPPVHIPDPYRRSRAQIGFDQIVDQIIDKRSGYEIKQNILT